MVIKKTFTKKLSKAQKGKIVKSTKDSTAYYDNIKNNAYNIAKEYEYSVGPGADVRKKAITMAFKATDALVRQAKKGKPGYDKNGFRIKKTTIKKKK